MANLLIIISFLLNYYGLIFFSPFYPLYIRMKTYFICLGPSFFQLTKINLEFS